MIHVEGRLHNQHTTPGHIYGNGKTDQADRRTRRYWYDRVNTDTGRISPSPLFIPGFLDTAGWTLQQRQTAFDRTNQDRYAILHLATDKAVALLVAMHS